MEDDEEGWTCQRCTLRNPRDATRCQSGCEDVGVSDEEEVGDEGFASDDADHDMARARAHRTRLATRIVLAHERRCVQFFLSCLRWLCARPPRFESGSRRQSTAPPRQTMLCASTRTSARHATNLAIPVTHAARLSSFRSLRTGTETGYVRHLANAFPWHPCAAVAGAGGASREEQNRACEEPRGGGRTARTGSCLHFGFACACCPWLAGCSDLSCL